MSGTGELLLYVDFDGVLHHENVLWHPERGPYLSAPERYALFQHSELLAQQLEPYPDVRVVLSTSWVIRYTPCQPTQSNRKRNEEPHNKHRRWIHRD